ncbi:MAG: hypothetical protein ACI915_004677 [Gammaproteobacteria bacterium]|jgi:hypothetical protein
MLANWGRHCAVNADFSVFDDSGKMNFAMSMKSRNTQLVLLSRQQGERRSAANMGPDTMRSIAANGVTQADDVLVVP